MDRRKFIHTAGASVTIGLSGCSDAFSTDSSRDTPEEGGEKLFSKKIPDAIGTIPREISDNGGAFLTQIDWQWYLSHSDVDISLDGEADVGWSLRTSQETATNPPEHKILRTPVWGVFLGVSGPVRGIQQFQEVSGPAFEHLGVAESGLNESAGSVKKVATYGKPSVVTLSGDIDVQAFVDATDSFVESQGSHGFVTFEGVDGGPSDTGGLRLGVRDDVVVFSTGRGNQAISEGDFEAVLAAHGGEGESTAEIDSVSQVSQKVSAPPVLVGELAGGSFPVEGTNYSNRGIDELPDLGSIVHGFRTDGTAGEVNVVMAGGESGSLTEDELANVFGGGEAEYEYSVDSAVAMASAVWE